MLSLLAATGFFRIAVVSGGPVFVTVMPVHIFSFCSPILASMTPRFKGKPNFDFSLPCPSCGYKIQPNELLRLGSHIIKCPDCGAVFDEMGGRKPLSTS
jgi:hypothetical protein